MENDFIEQAVPWVTPWFTSSNSHLSLEKKEREILTELSTRWASTDKLTLFNTLGDRYSRELVGRVIDKVVAAHIQPEWEENGRKESDGSMERFIQLLWGPLPAAGFDVEIQPRADGIQIHCTRCPHAENGIKNDAAFWLYHLVCSGDPYAAAGFNPQIGFRRTQTLMEGYPCCDHFYFMK